MGTKRYIEGLEVGMDDLLAVDSLSRPGQNLPDAYSMPRPLVV